MLNQPLRTLSAVEFSSTMSAFVLRDLIVWLIMQVFTMIVHNCVRIDGLTVCILCSHCGTTLYLQAS